MSRYSAPDLRQKSHVSPRDDHERKAFGFITEIIPHMDRASIALFRQEITREPQTENLVALIDCQIALRERSGRF